MLRNDRIFTVIPQRFQFFVQIQLLSISFLELIVFFLLLFVPTTFLVSAFPDPDFPRTQGPLDRSLSPLDLRRPQFVRSPPRLPIRSQYDTESINRVHSPLPEIEDTLCPWPSPRYRIAPWWWWWYLLNTRAHPPSSFTFFLTPLLSSLLDHFWPLNFAFLVLLLSDSHG